MLALRKALAALFLVFATVAFALTPGERIVLFSGIKPVWTANFLSPVLVASQTLPAGLTYSKSGSIPATLFDSTGKLTYQGNNLALYSGTDPSHLGSPAGTTPPTITQTTYGGQTVEAITFPTGATGYSASRRGGANGTYEGDWSQLNGVTYIAAQQIALSRPLTGGEVISVFQTGVQGAWTTTLTASTANPTTLQQYYIIGTANATGGQGTFVYSSGSALGSPVTVYITAFQVSAVTYQTTPPAYNATTSSIYLAPRLDTNPSTLAPAGLLVEEQRVQIAGYNRDLTNGVWTASNITPLKNMTGLDGVANSASRITAGANNGTILQTVTLASSQRAQSAYLQRITGIGTVYMTTDGGTTWVDVTSQVGSAGTWAWATIAAQTVTNPSFGFKLATSGDAIGVDIVQNENGAFATSAIINPTSSTVTRTADVVSGANYNATQGSIIAEFAAYSPATASQKVFSLSPVTQGKYLAAGTDGSAGWYNTGLQLSTGSANTPIRIGMTYNSTGLTTAASNVSSTYYQASSSSDYTGGATRFGLGSQTASAQFLNGWLRSIATYNAPMAKAPLQARVAIGAPY